MISRYPTRLASGDVIAAVSLEINHRITQRHFVGYLRRFTPQVMAAALAKSRDYLRQQAKPAWKA